MSLCLLLSSVFLLNTKGVLNEGLFNALSLVCNMAEHVEERGQEASKPALLWLLRDFILDLQDETGAAISPDGYLEQSLNAKPIVGQDHDRSRGAIEVRESLKKFFPQRHCSTLVQPVIDEDKLQRLSQLPYSELRHEFRQQVETMQRTTVELARKYPKLIAGQPIGGAALVMMLRKFVDSVNSNKALNIQSAWDAVQHNACADLVEELREATTTQLRKVANGAPLPSPAGLPLPVRDEILAQALKEGRRSLRKEFGSRAVGDEAVRSEYWRELKDSIQLDEQGLDRQNKKLAEEQLREAARSWEAWINGEGEGASSDPRSEELVKLIDKGMPSHPVSVVVREALNTARLSRLRWDGRVSAAKTEAKMLADELDSRKASASEAASVAAKDGSQAVEHVREVGRLQGQVEQLQTQVREAVMREQCMKEQVLAAEDGERKIKELQAQHDEVVEKCTDHIRTIKELSAKLKEKNQGGKAEAEDTGKKPLEINVPKKCCAVM